MAYKNIFGHFAVITGGTFINMLIGVFTTPIITRLVDPISYGQAAIFTLYGNIAVMIFCLGMDQTLVRYYYSSDSVTYKSALLSKCVFYPFVISIFLSLLFLSTRYFGLIDFDFDFAISGLLCVFVISSILNRFSFLVVRLSYFTKLYAILNIWHKLLYAIFVVLGVYILKGHFLFILTFSAVLSIVLTSVVGLIKNKKIWFGKKDVSLIPKNKELIRYGIPFILSMGIVSVFQGVSQFTIKAYRSFDEVGTFAAAMTMVHIFTILQSSINALWAPLTTEHFEKAPDKKDFFVKGNSYISILMFIFGIIVIASKDILALFLGPKFREASYILPCLVFIPIMYTISETTVIGINFSKKSHLHIWSATIGLCVSVVVNILLVPPLGNKGAAISSAISYIAFFSARSWLSQKCYKIPYNFSKLLSATFIVFCYAATNTFYQSTRLNLTGFAATLCLVIAIYRYDFLGCMRYIYASVSQHKKIKNL